MARDRDKYNAWMREWRKKNPVKCKRASNKWRENNKDHLREYNIQWSKDNPDKVKEHSRTKYLKHKEKILKDVKEYRKNNRDKVRVWEKRARDANPARFSEKRKRLWQRELARQDAKATRPRPELCEFGCGRGPVVYDHDHTTNEFRSWPCKYCNTAMGLVIDLSDVLRKMADVIDEHHEQHPDKIQLQKRPDAEKI